MQVVLLLHGRSVADAYGARPAVAGQVFELLFRQILLAADPVDRLQRSLLRDIAEEAHERLALGQMTETAATLRPRTAASRSQQ